MSEARFYQWRDRLLAGGLAALVTPRNKKLSAVARLLQARKNIA